VAACTLTARAEAGADATTATAIGLAFQIVDDVLDETQGSETLGKTAGKDADANKPTYRPSARSGGFARIEAASPAATRRWRRWTRSGLGRELRSQRLCANLAERIVAP
jgi:farnesyl diphosphate synthase